MGKVEKMEKILKENMQMTNKHKILNITNYIRNSNQNHTEVYHYPPPTPTRMSAIKKQKITRVGKDVKKLNPLCTIGGM